ncbi:Formin like protein 7 [Nosema bombycis CQ1]|uniref:Formin like protein 7 n=1 Tax=Nosema bombycis (strain CQ1 / CVCC 102059) TaxID=578461 RepID=R0KPU5_NOSB1|nr:Formin like protein 7 [Nosema bombycis CQ1]|eukprot:EOB12736.1 Formin like protein 7 [Nosema bombycis CQ1]
MGKMGLDEEKQNKLSHKLDLSKKIKTIISMQTLEERKKKICEYLERIRENFSLMSFLSLHCSLENGNKTLFSIFMNCKGEEIILKSIKEMEGDSINIILEFVFMLLKKYQWEVPSLLEIILKRYLEIKFKTNTFYKIIEYYIKKGDYEVIFKNTTPFGCVCNSYLSKIMCDYNNDVGSDDGTVGDSKDKGVEGGNVDTTKGINEKQSISFSFLLDLLKKGNLKLEYVNYIENIFLNKPNTIIKKKCKSERLYEIIRIAEEKNLLDLVTCVIESVVIGGKEYVTIESKEGKREEVSKGIKEEGGIQDIKGISKEEEGVKDLTLNKPNNDTPINQPNLNTTQPNLNTPPSNNKPQPTPTPLKKKIIKKIVKKSTPLFSYEQLKWTKINKKGTIFEKVTKIEFKDKDLEPFIKKEIIKKDNPFLNLNKKTTIFPDKKNYALNIALSRIKLSDKELKDKILNLSQDLNMNLIKQLLLYFPTEEEKGVLKGRVDRKVDCSKVDIKNGVKGPFSNTPSLSPTLSTPVSPTSPPSLPTPTSHNRAESFFIECIPQIDLFKESLLLLNLKSLLDSLPISHLDTLSFYYQTILSSIPLKDLLGTLLSLGNSLNKGTPLGQAEGFTFDSILNLITPKTKDILRSYCNLNLFKKEFKILYEVQKISLESFKMDFKEVNEIKKEINIKDLNLKDKYKKIENKYKETNEFYEKACEYLNEKINEEFNMKFLEIYLSVVE